MRFTGCKDTDFKIFHLLSIGDILNFSLVCKSYYIISKNEEFWKNYLKCKYSDKFLEYKNEDRSYKNYFIGIEYYLKKYSHSRSLKELCKRENNIDLVKCFYFYFCEKDLEYNQYDLYRAINCSIKYGNEEIFKFLVANFPIKGYTFSNVGKCKNQNIIDFCEKDGRIGKDSLERAIAEKNSDFIQKYSDILYNDIFNNDHYEFNPAQFAVKTGDLKYVESFMEISDKRFIINLCFVQSCRKGQLELAEHFYTFIDESQKGVSVRHGMKEAAKGGHIHIIEYLLEKGAKNIDGALEYAAKGGKMNVINFLIGKGIKNWKIGIFGAEIGGYREIQDFLNKKLEEENRKTLARREEAKKAKKERKGKEKRMNNIELKN